MNARTGLLSPIWATACAVFVIAASVTSGQQPVPTQNQPNGAQPAPASAPVAEHEAVPDMKKIAERLSPADRELVEQHAKSGELPADPAQRRVIAVVDSTYLGNEYAANNNPRFFIARLTLLNLTGDPVTLKRESLRLDFEGVIYFAKEAPETLKNRPFQAGQQYVQIRALPSPLEQTIPSGATGFTWAVFPQLPPGNHVPPIVLKYQAGAAEQAWDVIQHERAILGLKLERLGPRKSLGLIRIAGTMNTINLGSLVDELDRLAADRVVRAVIDWEPAAKIGELQIAHWLQNSAMSAGRAQQFNDQQFPGLPAPIRELHLSRIPSGNPGDTQTSGYPSNFVPVTAAVAGQRIHKSEAEAVVAALRSAYEALPRDEVLQAIQTGLPMERAAALAGGGGRLPPNRLSLILKYTDDADPIVQQAAVLALSNFGEREAITKLVACARGSSPVAANTAIAGLAGSRFEAAHSALLDLLGDAPAELQKTIVKIMAAYPRPRWSNALFEYAQDSKSGLNAEALQALVQVGHPELMKVLADTLHGSDANLQTQAFAILAARSDRESEELAVAYTLEHLKAKPAAPGMLPLLSRVKDRRALPLLLARFNEIPNKSELIQTLTRIGDEQTAKFLTERYPGLQNHEKAEVLRYLVRFDPLAFRHFAPQALISGDNSLVSTAVQGLQEDGSAEAIGILIDAFESGSHVFVWSYVANALAALGTSDCRTALRKARDTGKPEKRQYAVNALMMLRQRSPGIQFYMVGQQQSQANNYKEAIEHYDTAIELDPELSDAYAARGHALLAQEKYAEAGKDFAKAYEQDPFNSMGLTGVCLAMILTDGKVDEALKKLEADRGKFQNTAIFNYNAACVYGRAFEYLHKNPKAENRDKRLDDYKQAAIADLKKSIEQGFDDMELMKKDPDLALFRDLPEFQELIKNTPEPAQGAAAGRVPQAQRVRPVRAGGF